MDREDICRYERCLLPKHYGSGLDVPVFIGRYNQRGYGFGSVLSGLARNVIFPALKSLGGRLFKSAIRTIKPHAVRTASDLASDIILRRKNISQSLKDRGIKLAENVAKDIITQKGQGIKRKRRETEDFDIFTKKRRLKEIFP